MLTRIDYVAIRRCSDDGHEYMDTRHIWAGPTVVRWYTDIDDKQNPRWAKDNPVVRIAQIKIEEMGA